MNLQPSLRLAGHVFLEFFSHKASSLQVFASSVWAFNSSLMRPNRGYKRGGGGVLVRLAELCSSGLGLKDWI